jgi:hypothetical protein
MVFPAIAYFFYIIAYLSVALMESVLTVKAIPALLERAVDENESRASEIEMLATELDAQASNHDSPDSDD